MNLYGQIDLDAFFGVEDRILDGEEYLCIPLRFNPNIRRLGGRPTVLLNVREMRRPDEDGYTHTCQPYIPRSVRGTLQEADYIKMTNPIGRFRVLDPPAPREEKPDPGGIGHEMLAHNPVREKDIPL